MMILDFPLAGRLNSDKEHFIGIELVLSGWLTKI